MDEKYLELPQKISNLQYSISEAITKINGRALSLGALKYILNLDDLITHNALDDATDLMNCVKVYKSVKSDLSNFINKEKLDEVLSSYNKKGIGIKSFANLLEYIEETFSRNFSLSINSEELINVLKEDFSHSLTHEISVARDRHLFNINKLIGKENLDENTLEIAVTLDENLDKNNIDFRELIESGKTSSLEDKFYFLLEEDYISIAVSGEKLSVYKLNRKEALRNTRLYNALKDMIKRYCMKDAKPTYFKLNDLSKEKLEFLISNGVYRNEDNTKLIKSKDDYASIEILKGAKQI
jgi:hypothetical protein